MIHFYTNRQMAARLDINLSRWKRWSREFLPPDPIGGLQSGLARQYSLAEAFIVYLGGYLVASLNFSIPEARVILTDLQPLFDSLGLLDGSGRNRLVSGRSQEDIKAHYLRIWRLPGTKSAPIRFGYLLRQPLQAAKFNEPKQSVIEERVLETRFHHPNLKSFSDEPMSWRTLNIGYLHQGFMKRISQPIP